MSTVVTEKPAAAPAAPPAPAAATAAPLSTESLRAALRETFAPTAPKPDPNPHPGPLPSDGRGGTPAAIAPPATPEPETPPADPALNGEAAPGDAPAESAAPAAADPADDPKSWPKHAIDTVTALRAERRELKADLEAERASRLSIEQRIAKLEGSKPEEAPIDIPIRNASPEVKQLEQAEAQQRTVADWARSQLRAARQNPEAVVAELARHNVTVPDGEAAIAWLEDVRETALDKARTYVSRIEAHRVETQRTATQERQLSTAAARAVLPELSEKDSPRAQFRARVLAEHPELARHPRGELVVAAIILGMENPALQKVFAASAGATATATGNGNGNGHAKPPQAPPARLPGAATRLPASPTPTTAQTADALFEKYKKTGDPKDKEAWIKATIG